MWALKMCLFNKWVRKKMEVIHCEKIQFSCQNLQFFAKILYKTGKRGVIGCGLKDNKSH